MTTPLFEDPVPARPGVMARLAIAYAWLFALGSAWALGLILVRRSGAIEQGRSAIFGWTTPAGVRESGWLLGYDGREGYILAAALFAGTLAAIIGSTLRLAVVRQASLLALLAWSVVWAVGAARHLGAVGGGEAQAIMIATGAALACTYTRARVRWMLPERRTPRRATGALIA